MIATQAPPATTARRTATTISPGVPPLTTSEETVARTRPSTSQGQVLRSPVAIQSTATP